MAEMQPVMAGFIGLFVGGFFFYIAWTKAARGLDGTFSIANIQLILWTSAIMGSYVAIAAIKGGFLDQIPENTLILMGMSGASTSMASIIRSSQPKRTQENGDASTSESEPKKLSVAKIQMFEGLLTSESKPDIPSIAKIQMFAWNLVALGIYVVLAAGNIARGEPILPNVDQAILGLIGIGHGIYLANKVNDKP
jgi:hypothetical protein